MRLLFRAIVSSRTSICALATLKPPSLVYLSPQKTENTCTSTPPRAKRSRSECVLPRRSSSRRSPRRSGEHTSELQSLMRTSYAVFCLNKKPTSTRQHTHTKHSTTPHTHLRPLKQ